MRLPTFFRSKRSVTTVEFAIVAPVVMIFLFGIVGVGLDGFYQFTLDDALRNATRQLAMDGPAEASAGNFVSAVCAEFGVLDGDCLTNLTYDVQGDSLAAGFAAMTPATLSAAGNLNDGFFSNPAGSGYANYDNYVLQVAYPMPFALPFVAQMITFTGTGSIMATTVARGEPFN